MSLPTPILGLKKAQDGDNARDYLANDLADSLTILDSAILLTAGATGDIWYRNAGGLFTKLPIGAAGNLLTVAGGLPTWAAPAAIPPASLTTIGPTFNTGNVTMPTAATFVTAVTLGSTLANGGTYLLSANIEYVLVNLADLGIIQIYDSTNAVVIASVSNSQPTALSRQARAISPIRYSGFAGNPTIILRMQNNTSGSASSAVYQDDSTGNNKATWIQALKVA